MEKLIVFDLDITLWNAGGTWCDHTNPPFENMIFFDDEMRNISEIEALGVEAIFVENGLKRKLFSL